MSDPVLSPETRLEMFLARAAGDPAPVLTPETRLEMFLQRIIDNGGGGGSITVDAQLSLSSTNPVQNRIITNQIQAILDQIADWDTLLSQKEEKPIFVDVVGSTPTISAQAGRIYNCGTLTSLTVDTFPVSGAWSIVFTSGATPTVTSFPQNILGLESFAAAANTLYEINVLDGRAVVGSWAVSST